MSQSFFIENPMGSQAQQFSCYPQHHHHHNHNHNNQNQQHTECSCIINNSNSATTTTTTMGKNNIIAPETHKSMWAVNTFYDSNQDINNDSQSINYRTRSLPSWGKGKQRPASSIDDLEELYAQVNFTKKRRNRMRNDNASIIARCRSRSQNLTSLNLEGEGVVVYDERTAL